jgi:hypothetical protein
LRAALTGSQRLAGRRQLNPSRPWNHELIRRSFTLANVKGSVETIDLTCDAESRELKYVPDTDWHVPADWTDCGISVKGKPGTEFDIVEFPDRPASAP